MKNPLYKLVLLLTLFFSSGVYSQKVIDFQKIYGSDPLLYNGRLYRFYQPASTKGYPFLYEKFSIGEIKLRGQHYPDQLINFDIHNGQLVLQYTSPDGGINRIIVSEAWLENFEVNGSVFEPVDIGNSNIAICKVLKADKISLAYNLRKDLIMDNTIGAVNMQFSKPIRTAYLVSPNKSQRYTNNKSFISFFDDNIQQEIKKYMRKNRINVKKSGDQEMTGLLNFCSTLI